MRLDNNLKDNAYSVLEKYGITPSQAVRMFFNQIANTGKIPLTFDWAGNTPNETTIAAIEAAERDEVVRYESAVDATAAMLKVAEE